MDIVFIYSGGGSEVRKPSAIVDTTAHPSTTLIPRWACAPPESSRRRYAGSKDCSGSQAVP